MDALLELTSPDFEFVPYLANLVETATYRGHDGLRSYFEDADTAWEQIRVELHDVRAVAGRTVAAGELRGRGRASGLETRVPLAWVGEERDGKLVRLESFASMDDALAALRR